MTIDSKERHFTFLCEQVQLCMLPALNKDLDDVQILPAHFESYHNLLRQELPKLYDVLQRNEEILFNDSSYQEVCEILFLKHFANFTITFSCAHNSCYCFAN